MFALEMSLAAEQSGLWNFLFFTFRMLIGHALAAGAVAAGSVGVAGSVAIAGIVSAAAGATAAAAAAVGLAPVGASRSCLIRPRGCCGGDGGAAFAGDLRGFG